MMHHHIPRLQLYAAMGARKDEEDLSSDDSESYDSESDERDSDIEVKAVGSDGGASVTQEESNHTTL